MAIYSLNLKSIGRTTHAAGTAGAHLLYIARDGAVPELVSEHMPCDPNTARAWMNRAESADRKNARVIDKVRIALPRELNPEQRMQLVRDFAQELTGGRVAWFAAIHATGKDAHNPHCHLVIRDRDIDTGRRVVKLSDSARDRQKAGLEPKAVEWVRAKWEDHANRALDAAGHDVRIDRRTLEAQGIDRTPTIHIGPQAIHVEDFVERPSSKIVETGNGRSIDYPQIDEGRTRKERHAEIVDFNIEKAARSQDYRTREIAKMQREQKALDDALEKQLIREAHARTWEQRQARKAYRAELKMIRNDHRAHATGVKAMLREDWTSRRDALTARHRDERDALRKDQGKISARVLRVIDVTGATRRRQDEERRALRDKHRQERIGLVASHRDLRATSMAELAQRREIMRREVKAAHAPDMARMAARHKQAEIEADRQRQMRAAEREQVEVRTERTITQAEKLYRDMQKSRGRDRGFDLGR